MEKHHGGGVAGCSCCHDAVRVKVAMLGLGHSAGKGPCPGAGLLL
jgi:hypothetical protein